MLMKDNVYRVNKNCLVHTNRIGKYQFTGEGDVAVLIDDNGEYFSIKPVHLEPYVKPIKILVIRPHHGLEGTLEISNAPANSVFEVQVPEDKTGGFDVLTFIKAKVKTNENGEWKGSFLIRGGN